MVVTVWKIREWEGDVHGRAVKYPGMKTGAQERREMEGKKLWVSSDVLPGWEWQRTGAARKRDRMQARRSWNQFKWYHSAPPFSTSPPTPPPFSSSTLLASQHFPFSFSLLGLFHCFVKHCRRGGEYSVAARSTALLWTVTLLLFTHLSALFLHQLHFKKTSGVATHIGKVGCWHFFLSSDLGFYALFMLGSGIFSSK